jgi:hypothetical protein
MVSPWWRAAQRANGIGVRAEAAQREVPRSPGRKSFEDKRREVMHSPSHWVEIDLLRGIRMVPVPKKKAGPHEYLVQGAHAWEVAESVTLRRLAPHAIIDDGRILVARD